ncbi:MAG: metallophosphoesterase family protein [Oscillospiraceae bacterium]|nr:metallophosphoesterase family protein [Oscillospiraceae bacterium]
MKLGIISDTHKLLRPELSAALAGVDAILHAGDVGSREILDRLEALAPVYAVRGNADGDWAEDLPTILDFTLDGLRICMTHKKKDLPRDLDAWDLAVVGHSHQFAQAELMHTLLLNPGSCGPRRFRQPITMALAETSEGQIQVTRIDLVQAAPKPKIDPRDVKAQIELVIRELGKGRGPERIAEKYGMDPALADQIARLWLTHPGVTPDGIMAKMGL